MRTLGSVAALVASVQEDTAAEVERLERAGAEALARLEAAPADPREQEAAAERALRLGEVRAEEREALAREDWLDRRALLELREAWTQGVVERVRRRVANEPSAPARLARLERQVREALAQVQGAALEVLVPPRDAALLTGEAAARLAAEAGVALGVTADARLAPGGCRVRTADGKVALDVGLEARLQRLERRWRAALGEVFER